MKHVSYRMGIRTLGYMCESENTMKEIWYLKGIIESTVPMTQGIQVIFSHSTSMTLGNVMPGLVLIGITFSDGNVSVVIKHIR